MKIQILSDLHLEHGGTIPPHVPEADVIVLAGDPAPYTEGLVERLRNHWWTAHDIVYVLVDHLGAADRCHRRLPGRPAAFPDGAVDDGHDVLHARNSPTLRVPG